MPPISSSSRLSASSNGSLTWRPTKIMNMRDLSKDDDFLSHLLVEKLGTGTVPLLVHKMDSSRRLPKTDTQDLMKIVRRLVTSKLPLQQSVRQAVDELLMLPPIRYYLKSYTQKQINAFATHASRYFELYNPAGSIEIAHTSRYSHRTGKSELCILATRNLSPGTVVTELKGSMANLTDEEDKELKRTDLRNSDIRRDFSVIHSKSMKKNHLFLGPARFVNHDCDHNCELFREGRYITFRVLRPIAIGEEITAHYGDGYFGKKNRHCLCETCEKNGRGGYSPDHQEEQAESSSSSSSGSDSDSDSDSSTSSSDSETEAPKPILNMNERRTRRGVYAITKPDSDSSDDSDNEEDDDDKVPLANAKDIPSDGEIELTAEIDSGSDLTSLAPSNSASPGKRSAAGSMTPARGVGSRSSSSLTELTSSTGRSITPKSTVSTPFRSIIATRRQKVTNLKSTTPGSSVEPSPKRITRSVSSQMLSEKRGKGKGKGKATPTPVATPKSGRASKSSGKDEVKIKKEDVEPRVLRTRQSFVVPDPVKETPPEPVVPRGPDGRPLPTCSTCSNVLPLIAVDSKVVWGLGIEASRKKKNDKHDCPRCLRHFAIYQQKWPCRVAPRGTISESPREDSVPPETITKKVTPKGLQILNRKLAAAAATVSKGKGKKRSRREEEEDEEEEEEEERPIKRRKSMPEPILRKGKIVKTYSSSARRAKRAASPALSEDSSRRRRGRPLLPSGRKSVRARVKVEEPPPEVEKSLLRQPRSVNGRFGKKAAKRGAEFNTKGNPSAADRYQSKHQDDSEDSDSANEESLRKETFSPNNKRSRDIVDDVEAEDVPRKKSSSGNDADEEVEVPLVAHKVLPRPASKFRGGGLFSNPNPLQFALYAWAGPVLLDDSSSDDEKHPETPEDDHSITAGVATPEEDIPSFTASNIIHRPALSHKPSPYRMGPKNWMNFERRYQDRGIKTFKIRTDDESLNVSRDSLISSIPETYSPPLSPDDDDKLPPPKLRHIYPVLPSASAASNAFIPKSSHFPSNSETKPTFINAGWDDASDASEA
uniref:SET domain-containing protein n=1 Tax=Psilocybe cubensis TaxID=181762 RepID=A0A8H7Y7A8_PSICU